ncbi:MAG: phosphoadenosine phosphosulfate reductase family protein [Thermoplasmata archaeon]|nr:phosphoadenosine phosphosulfate reductase family protein [Thermoplasmata archaeon]
MGAVILGKIHLRWCDECNLPILEQPTCGICGGKTRPIKLTPPGDARPAFRSDIERIRSLIDAQFGVGCGEAMLPEGRTILLNKAPDIDRMDEVIVDGTIVGTVRYELLKGEKFLLRPAGAAAIAPLARKGWVVIDPGAAKAVLEKSASTLAVGVQECDLGIVPGDEVLVLTEGREPVSVGTSKMSASEMMEHKRGTAIKTRWKVAPEPRAGAKKATWDDAVRANSEVIARRVNESKRFIHDIMSENDIPVAVSYSGGKDSLATLLLVLDAGIRPKLLFIDTGLEFEETKRNVSEVAREHSLELIVESAGDSFWRNLEHFGPPAKDFRWCCKTCKLGPATQLIQKHFPKGVLSFIGQRAYESQQRAEKSRVWRNPWTPNQLAASPIQKWTALHVWLYLMSKGAKANPLYEQGLERIGCFMCPATDLAELRRVKEIGGEYDRWQRFIEEHASVKGKPRAWVEYDLWRWKRLPKSVVDELGPAHREDFSHCVEPTEDSPLRFESTSGYNPCVEGLSMEGVFSRPLPMERVANMLEIVGRVNTSPDGSIAEVKSITVFREGPVMIRAKDEGELREKAEMLREIVFRAVECAGCGICTGRCPNGALHLDGLVTIDPTKCDHCGRCLGPCPAVRFKQDDLDI